MMDGPTVPIVLIVALLVLFATAFPGAEQRGCENRWENSGMMAVYTSSSGCRVEVSAGLWVPEAVVKLEGGARQ